MKKNNLLIDFLLVILRKTQLSLALRDNLFFSHVYVLFHHKIAYDSIYHLLITKKKSYNYKRENHVHHFLFFLFFQEMLVKYIKVM